MLAGDYTKYLDDSIQGLDAWKRTWVELATARHFKIILDVQYEYLRLYIHGFVFQAAISRLPKGPFPNGVLATPDGRYVLLAIDAVKWVLEMLGMGIDPVRRLQYLGPQFYLYTIHCAVFLYKTASYGAISELERRRCAEVVQQYTGTLQTAVVSDKQIAARHATLLTTLWSTERAGLASSSSNGQQTNGTVNATARLLDVELPVMDLSFNDLDVFNFVDFDPYGEPDLRNWIPL
jgi:hypothetical protein